MAPTPTALKDDPMMINNTLAQLRELKLAGMASAVEEQLSSSASNIRSTSRAPRFAFKRSRIGVPIRRSWVSRT